jgi:hypothetical protein
MDRHIVDMLVWWITSTGLTRFELLCHGTSNLALIYISVIDIRLDITYVYEINV